tara:strand:+ start:959 stop:1495 length:537 start_codon:yes stop_codon:yes gene_type:complete
MSYYNELKKSMDYLGKNPKTKFLGQAVLDKGTAMTNTFNDINKGKLIELPVVEEMQMGITTGLIMQGYIPVSIYPRMNFLLLAINQLVNHLDKLNEMTKNYYKSKAIIRTAVGSKKPLDPKSQHVGDFSYSLKRMAKNLNIVCLKETEQIFPEYKKALNRKDNVSTILIEYADYYNSK